ncbi:hypothetical protein [Gulosibacter sp. ACHW.36C]|uniref:Uncharacterized protein n=1 Tax=Gulosibacter sediminis TaxID=1729695 RepID=A0ABY4MXD5_9MICO|nr:hypothetical protein [Gulosibacter sediminis]UQN14444.1 hypothetical protein M3M28_10335 [Gulosibacter sediminis]
MTATLLKHEYLRTRTFLGLLLGGGLAIVALSTLFALMEWPVLSELGVALGVVVTLLLLPATQIALAVDYWRSSYRQLGYFTQSIPAKGSTIYWAKMLWAWLASIAAMVVTAAAALIFWTAFGPMLGLAGNPFTMAGELLDFASQYASSGMLTAIVVSFVLLMLVWPVQYFFCVSIGSEAPLNRFGIGGPIIVLIAFYFVTQLITTFAILILPFGLGLEGGNLAVVSFETNFFDAFAGNGNDDVMPLGFLPALALIAAACLWRTHYSWNRKVSLV